MSSRTIVKTTNAGWYIDPQDPDGPRIRKREGDIIITLEEFETSRGNGAGNRTVSQERAAHAAKGAHAAKTARNKPEQTATEKAKSVPTVASETGKVLRGKTTTIKCQFKLEDGKKCGKERVVKVQDAFQVKYCVEHQAIHRRMIKRDKLKAKRQAAKAAAGK